MTICRPRTLTRRLDDSLSWGSNRQGASRLDNLQDSGNLAQQCTSQSTIRPPSHSSLRDQKLAIPEDISLVGFDEPHMKSALAFVLATVRISWRRVSPVLALVPGAILAADYHADSRSGDDTRDGRTAATAWRTLDRVNAASFKPGDRVLFRAGSTWSGQLRIVAQGEPRRPIIFRSFGQGSRPRIDTAGAFEDAVLIRNAQHVEVRDFELTNHGESNQTRRGVNLVADNCGTLTNILVSGLFIHDVNGTQRRKNTGGIIFHSFGDHQPSRYNGLRIERNIIWHIDRSGIAAQSHHSARTRWFPSTNVVIRDNWVGDAGGDGIVPWATDGCLVEHNIVQGANERAGTYNAGIWPWSTDNTVLRLNRASGVKTLLDGQGFDSDYNSRNTVLEFNLSHDNEGGFLLICTPGKRKPEDNLGNLGTIARYNISRHDRARSFNISAVEHTRVRHNAIYIGPGHEVQVVLLSNWSGWAKDLELRDNLFHSEGLARYGHEISRTKDGAYGIGPGWGPALEVVSRGNRYVGHHEDRPAEADPASASAPRPISFNDWPGPQFDPRRPETFDAYLKAHRRWMLRLMERQFGRTPLREAGLRPR